MKRFALLTIMTLAVALCVFAADVTGKWTGQVQGRNGSQDVTFNLKADGSKLTGTVTGGMGGRGGGGGAAQAHEISDGKIEGSNISFTVKVEFNGQARTTTYTGTLAGDELKMKSTREGRNGAQTSEFTLKRSTT
jgi:hypothetical protein